MSLLLTGLGTALPVHSIEQEEALAIAETICRPAADDGRLVRSLYRRAGVRRRHSVLLENAAGTQPRQTFFAPMNGALPPAPTTGQRMRRYEQEAGPLAARAAQQALADAQRAPAAVTHLVTVSCSGFHAPGIDIELIDTLRLSPAVARTHVGFMGCHGALNGLRVARAYVDADPAACVLLCAVELCSLHFHTGDDADKLVANALFADGAAACIGIHAPLARREKTGNDRAFGLVANGSALFPAGKKAMTWRIGDEGFEMGLSPEIPALIAAHVVPWLETWLERQGLAMAAVGSWAVHPGGPRILTAFEKAAGLPPEALAVSRAVLAECGNMSSPTVLFILERMRRRGLPLPCVLLGFGPGLTVEAALIQAEPQPPGAAEIPRQTGA